MANLYVMIEKIINAVIGTKAERDIKGLLPLLHKINSLESWALQLKDEDFKTETEKFKTRLKNGETLSDIMCEAFALAREACRRVLGERPYDVQILGGLALHHGKITEMKTGEGKTLTSVTSAYLNALEGNGVHIVTVNDYLAERDCNWMGNVHRFMGLSVGAILSDMDTQTRRKAYACDITYGTNNELGFDYLRDNMKWDIRDKAQRSHAYCIIDEIDSILIDEARTPLIISGPVEEDTSKISLVNTLIDTLKEVTKDPATGLYPIEDPLEKMVHDGDFKLDEKSRKVSFTDNGLNKIEEILMGRKIINSSLFADENYEYIHYFTQALKAKFLFHNDVDYVVQNGEVDIVDEFTGRILHGRRYSDGLHQAIEAKEGIRVAERNVTLATITFQNFFRMYKKISGMTGTADTEAREFAKIYNLDVCVVPSNKQLKRIDEQDEIYLNEEFKFTAIANEVKEAQEKGQPVLIGTVSVEKSELLSKFFTKNGIRHEVLNAKNHHREAMIIAEAGAKGSVTIATNMAGRGTDIKLGGNPELRASKKVGLDAEKEVYERALAIEKEKCLAECKEILSLGGLFVIGTERHESRRIDNQLRGRSGRQGDHGRSKFYVSLDDDLMRLFGGDRFRNMMASLGMDSGEALQHSMITKSIERAQKRVEDRNYEIRKHLLDYDDVLNKQRTYIYTVRDSVLSDENIKDRLLKTGKDLATETLHDYLKNAKQDVSIANDTLLKDLKNRLGFTADDIASFLALENSAKQDILFKHLEKNIDEKASVMPNEALNKFIQFQYLSLIDEKWLEHLEAMEALREAVSLRSYAQKNPLVEYKNEGFSMFNLMVSEIPLILSSKIFNVRIENAENSQKSKEISSGVATHTSLNNLDVMKNGQKAAATVKATIKTEKVGRNDPCPCGSGKKYKFCHGTK